MKSADSSQFPWQRRAVPAHSALLLSTEPRPLPPLLPQFSSFFSASFCFCLFFPRCCCCCHRMWGCDPTGQPGSVSSSAAVSPSLCFSFPQLLQCSLLPALTSFTSSFTLLSHLFWPKLLLQLQLQFPHTRNSHFPSCPCSLVQRAAEWPSAGFNSVVSGSWFQTALAGDKFDGRGLVFVVDELLGAASARAGREVFVFLGTPSFGHVK